MSSYAGQARGGKHQAAFDHCLHEIATGRWREGHRLPSVREAEKLWRVNRLTVLRAYRRLEALGLVRSADRSGFFVAEAAGVERVSRHRHELERLFDRALESVERGTDLSPLGVFRYFAHLAEIHDRERPRCAFVECTAIQSQGHVREIATRLGVPALALTTADVAGGPSCVPDHVRTILTSHWHHEEIAPLGDAPNVRVASVRIEISPRLADTLPDGVKEAVVLDDNETKAAPMVRDAAERFGNIVVRSEIVDSVIDALPPMLTRGGKGARQRVLLLSPRFWGVVDPKWRDHPQVRPITFTICEPAWPAVADAIGLPLGLAGGNGPAACAT